MHNEQDERAEFIAGCIAFVGILAMVLLVVAS